MNKLILIIALVAAALIAVILTTEDSADHSAANARKGVAVAVILSGPKDDNGWSTAHFNGFETLKNRPDISVSYREHVAFDDESVFRDVIRQGARIVFATSFGYGDIVMKLADEYPDVRFYHCTGLREADNVATYMGRMYQMRYLSGLAAGLQTKSNHIGYVAAMPIHEVVRGLNAFTLGVRKINPSAIVHVKWTGTWIDVNLEEKAAEALLADHPIDVLAYHQDSETVIKVAKKHGIAAIGYHVDKGQRYPDTALTSLVWNWGPFYNSAVTAVLEDNFKGRRYWEGARTGIVDLAPFGKFTNSRIATLVAREKARIATGSWDVFHGPVRDSNGALRVEEGSGMSDRQLLGEFNWFVEGIEQSEL